MARQKAKKKQPPKSKKSKKNKPKTQIKKTKSSSETVAKIHKVYEYFGDLESIKEDAPGIKKWLKKKNKFLLVYGGTKADRGKILDFFWEKTKRFIPKEFPLIVKSKINCLEKDDEELEKMIFFSESRKVLENYLNNSDIVNYYNEREKEADVEYDLYNNLKLELKKKYGKEIKNILKKYNRTKKRYSDLTKEYKFYKRKLLDKDLTAFFSICKDAFSDLEEYDGKSKGLFFIELTHAYNAFSHCNILFLHGVSDKNNNTWTKLCAEFLNDSSLCRYDLIIGEAEREEDVNGVLGTFKKMFEAISLTKLEFNDDLCEVNINEVSIAIKPERNYKFLKLLYENRKRDTSKEEIGQEILNAGPEGFDDQSIFNMRTQVESKTKEYGLHIECKKKVGYRLIL